MRGDVDGGSEEVVGEPRAEKGGCISNEDMLTTKLYLERGYAYNQPSYI